MMLASLLLRLLLVPPATAVVAHPSSAQPADASALPQLPTMVVALQPLTPLVESRRRAPGPRNA